MKRPTITLAVIAKNEEKNIPRLFESIKGCFDSIAFTDTGSTDKTIETAKIWADKIGTPIDISNFKWIDDFSAARNFNFSQVKTDYVMWMDLDDVMSDRKAFIDWRDHSMALTDIWMALYDYAHDDQGNCVCSFTRERVMKMNRKPTWKYFLHEGFMTMDIPRAHMNFNHAITWKVIHKRTAEDMRKDKSRNLNIFETNIKKGPLDSRMTYYYGKELFENGHHEKAYQTLVEANSKKDLELHDRIIAIQHAALSAIEMGKKFQPTVPEYAQWFQKSIEMCHLGLQVMPNRAEFYTTIADSYLHMGNMIAALPYYSAAKKCLGVAMPGDNTPTAIFAHPYIYGKYPRYKISEILFQIGDFEGSLKELEECQSLYKDDYSRQMIAQVKASKDLTTVNPDAQQVDDIIISSPPQSAYEWDEVLATQKGMGGSETAAIEMAKHLKKLTGRVVKVFNMRKNDLIALSGVEYIDAMKSVHYFKNFKPAIHIAWRHNIKLTNAPTYLWCHDLLTPSVEKFKNFDKILCLTPFHKNYVKSMQGIPEDQIIVTRNGIDPLKFLVEKPIKNTKKVIFPSSPDRGLDRAMKILDIVRSKGHDVELHVYYGLENLEKFGLSDLARDLRDMMRERPWVKYHGFTQQDQLAKEMMEAVIWLHPANFIETFCITAIESLCSGVYPVTRRLGALQDTLKVAEKEGMATLLDINCETPEEYEAWANATIDALVNKKWEKVEVDPCQFSWESVAREWMEFMGLEYKKPDLEKPNVSKKPVLHKTKHINQEEARH